MLRKYRLEQGKVVEVDADDAPILMVIEPSPAERAELVTRFQIDAHNLGSALDPNELPRMELEDNHLAVIFKHPKSYQAADNFHFLTNSVGLFLFQDRLVIVAAFDMGGFGGRAYSKIQNLQLLFLRILSQCVVSFTGHLQVINDIATELESKLVTAMENRSLLMMFAIEKSLVYYVNAVSANGRVIERLKANARNVQTIGLTPEMIDYVDDVAIENAQCLEQAQVYANVFAGLMDARASIVSNNLNQLIKTLTVITVVFMPLNVLASIGGMSEFTRFTEGVPWPVAYALFCLGLIGIGYITYLILRVIEKAPRRRR